MNDMLFLEKNIRDYIPSFNPAVSFKKPQSCPHCGINTDSLLVFHKTFVYDESVKENLLIFVWKCTACKKTYVSFHNVSNNSITYMGVFPQKTVSFSDEYLLKVSPKFIEIYNQALTAEKNGSFELAAIGFRTSLEILIKDYAINCLKENKDEVIATNLNNAISKYLKTDDMINTADVVRILGNDHTHYERKYPEHDFILLKEYMDIFISLVRTKIMIQDPPVSR